jgi:hypothetical protein
MNSCNLIQTRGLSLDCLAAALLRMELEIGLQDDVRVFVPQPVKPVVGQIEIEDALAGKTESKIYFYLSIN